MDRADTTFALIGYLLFMSTDKLVEASPFILMWISSPAIVWWFSLPLPANKTTLTPSQKINLRILARKTWAFFETLIGPADHWLPPDNLQLYPIPVIAHRTSPTNIGIALLANLTAHDFGYLAVDQFLERTRYSFESMEKLERYSGHFYNWYDLKRSGVFTQPYYISTVDSSNLVGHLLTLRQGLLGIANKTIFPRKYMGGAS